jgi:uncharacterized protein YcbX
MLRVSELFIYPIKSLGGISLSDALVTDRGFQHDRRWMLVDEHYEFITQRSIPQMALLQTEITSEGLKVYHKKSLKEIFIPFEPLGETVAVQVWSDRCKGVVVNKKVDEWFSDMLGKTCRLVYMPAATKRRVDGRYALQKEITSFTDGYPFMVIGQSSLNDLNTRLEEKLPINRFRPNIIFAGGTPYEEDTWAQCTINGINFYGVKLCARCVITTINQENIQKRKEPLKTLTSYRMKNNKIYFGQNLLHQGEGRIHVGDSIYVIERKPSRF